MIVLKGFRAIFVIFFAFILSNFRSAECSSEDILDHVISDTPDGAKIVSQIHEEEITETKLHKEKDKDDAYAEMVASLHQNHPYTKDSAVRLKMIGERKPVRMTQGERNMTLNFHNELRMSEANLKQISDMPYVHWAEELAEMAQALADTCIFEHYNIHRPSGVLIGQNMGYIISKPLPPEAQFRKIIQAFFDEGENMNPRTFTCRRGTVCGHYRQIIFSHVTRLGCAYAECSAIWHLYLKRTNPEFVYNPYQPGEPIFFGVCNYAEYAAHNMKMFHYGPPCTFCSLDKSSRQRCVNSQRMPSPDSALCDGCESKMEKCEFFDGSCARIKYAPARRMLCRLVRWRPYLCKNAAVIRTMCSDRCKTLPCRQKNCDLYLDGITPYNLDTSRCPRAQP